MTSVEKARSNEVCTDLLNQSTKTDELLEAEVLPALDKLTIAQEKTISDRPKRQPPRLNKSHGFMRFIVRNQVSRKDYEEEQAAKKTTQEAGGEDKETNKTVRERKAIRIRPGYETYKPPHSRKLED